MKCTFLTYTKHLAIVALFISTYFRYFVLLNTIEIVLPTAAHFMSVLIEKTSRIEAPLWIVLIER